MSQYSSFFIGLVIVSISLNSSDLSAGDGCVRCGCTCPCQKTCRLVCEEKKVTVTCWGCQCEDFCLAGPGKRGCEHCEEVCAECTTQPNSVHAEPKPFVWFDWCPGNAKMFTKQKLMKKTITKTVPSYKWVVEDLCAACQSENKSVDVPPGTRVPPPPLPLPVK
jgi:hypothetical protein